MGVSVQEQSCSDTKLQSSVRRAQGAGAWTPSAHPAQNCEQRQGRALPVPEESAVLQSEPR